VFARAAIAALYYKTLISSRAVTAGLWGRLATCLLKLAERVIQRRLPTGAQDCRPSMRRLFCVKQKILIFDLPEFGSWHSADLSLLGPGGLGV
jgi:hypothetical protein